jgi:hypothetical protein
MTLNNTEVRIWYERVVREIPDQLDPSMTREEQARQAYRLRGEALRRARALMSVRAHVAMLKGPIAWDDLIAKYRRLGYAGDGLWHAIIDAASRPGRAPTLRYTQS